MSQKSLLSAKELAKLPRRNKKHEENLQLAVCNYIRLKYPNVVFFCDLSSGMKLAIHVAARNKKMKSENGIPDLFIARKKPPYNGLFLELKKEGYKIFKKDGKTPVNEHIEQQMKVHDKLRLEGFRVEFGIGLADCIHRIHDYMNLQDY